MEKPLCLDPRMVSLDPEQVRPVFNEQIMSLRIRGFLELVASNNKNAPLIWPKRFYFSLLKQEQRDEIKKNKVHKPTTERRNPAVCDIKSGSGGVEEGKERRGLGLRRRRQGGVEMGDLARGVGNEQICPSKLVTSWAHDQFPIQNINRSQQRVGIETNSKCKVKIVQMELEGPK